MGLYKQQEVIRTLRGSSIPSDLSRVPVQAPAVMINFFVLKVAFAVLTVITAPGIISVTGCSSNNFPPADTNSF